MIFKFLKIRIDFIIPFIRLGESIFLKNLVILLWYNTFWGDSMRNYKKKIKKLKNKNTDLQCQIKEMASIIEELAEHQFESWQDIKNKMKKIRTLSI